MKSVGTDKLYFTVALQNSIFPLFGLFVCNFVQIDLA